MENTHNPVKNLVRVVKVSATEGQAVSEKLTLEKGALRILGVQAVSSRPDKLLYRGRIGIEVSGYVVRPEDHHAMLLMASVAVPQNERYHMMNYKTGNNEVKVTLTDVAHPAIVFADYDLYLYMVIEFENPNGGDTEINEQFG